MSKIVIALGGNALGKNVQEQKDLVKIPAQKIASLVAKGHNVVVGHGNGPQVGMIYNSFNNSNIDMPFPESGAMSQGYIGYHLMTSILNEFKKNNIDKDVLYFLTETLVDQNDLAFNNPTKPIGSFYKTEQEAIEANPGSTIKEDSGRGYRKVVPSPLPQSILGINTIKKNINLGNVVIVGGGGGIPMVFDGIEYKGVDAVIDKDCALSKIANDINADTFIILTSVDYVSINYNKENQEDLKSIDSKILKKYLEEGHFAKGSMFEKVLAAIAFVEAKKGSRKAIIANLEKVEEAIEGLSGTLIY